MCYYANQWRANELPFDTIVELSQRRKCKQTKDVIPTVLAIFKKPTRQSNMIEFLTITVAFSTFGLLNLTGLG